MPTAAKTAAATEAEAEAEAEALRPVTTANANWLTQFLGNFYVQWTFLLLALALSVSLYLVVGFLVINVFGFGQVKWQRGTRHGHEASGRSGCGNVLVTVFP